MGVHGLTKLLNQEGLLPSHTCCTQTLWRDSESTLFSGEGSERIRQIPPHSTLAIDGNGLAYYLHRVAYSRHFALVTGATASASPQQQQQRFCSCPRKKTLSQSQVTQLLPQFMPLALLEQVTKEFVESLKRHNVSLRVYWDGEGRRMKAVTLSKRKGVRDDEWGNLQQFCLCGVVSSDASVACQRDWVSNFPMTRLLMTQVRSTLAAFRDVSMIPCEEEADVQVARASAELDDCYCVGLDSDFCLFPNTKYVPVNTLDATGSVLTGCVLTRADLAEHLNLPTEESIVEMAILMGTDYVPDPRDAKLDYEGKFDFENILEFLKEQGPGYKVSSQSDQVERAMDFSRKLCSFQDLSEFPLDDESDSVSESSIEEDEDSQMDGAELNRPELPVALDLSLVELKPLDSSLLEVAMRPLQAYVDMLEEGEQMASVHIQQEHLEAFRNTVQALEKAPRSSTDEWTHQARPEWKDVLVAYVIERVLAFVIRNNPSAPAVKLTSPSRLFDHYFFYSILQAEREKTAAPTKAVKDLMKEPGTPETTKLPIDEHEDSILKAIESHQVTVIQGSTGCGKSSRVPVMLLRASPPDSSLKQVKMFISQPRRIAAKSLVERVRSCEPDLRQFIALRMGHGVREYETPRTRAWFVTTGYLVRLLANHPERFDHCSHLIIDEVHERSVDTDILCLLCRRLLDTNKRIRLVLMSATMAATLYQQYFGVPEPPIYVGARRFPIHEFFLEDILKRFRLPPGDAKAAKAVMNDCDKLMCKSPPSNSYMENLFKLAVRVTLFVGRPGSSVLIFVPGMNEIISITDLLERIYVPGLRYTCFPIHSDIPFDEQMAAFDSPAPDEVKVVIATNAAESSVTLPDVDHVICLGLCKQIIYNPSSHRQMLMPAWISRASATQRAGRTGRVRDGHVYRLYTRTCFEQFMDMFETGEMLRIPLDSVILTLKEMLKEAATPVLLQCLEPPDLSTIERSFESLARSRFITEPNDDGNITTLGAFVSSLGIDLALGSLIGLGIQFGVGSEAIELAAVLSFPKTPWIMTNPLYHEAATYNELTAKTYMSRCHFDANLYSDPLAIMNLMWDFECAQHKNGWAWHFSVSAQRLRRLITTRNSLRNRVADFVGIDNGSLAVEQPPRIMPHAKVTILRVLQTWVFSDTMIESIQAVSTVDGSLTLGLTGDAIDHSHLEQVLHPERHFYSLVRNSEIDQNGSFTPVTDDDMFDLQEFLPGFERRLLSYAIEKEYDMVWYTTEESLHLFARDDLLDWDGFAKFRESRLKSLDETGLVLVRHSDAKRRGRNQRACGLWGIFCEGDEEPQTLTAKDAVRLRKWSTSEKKKVSSVFRHLKRHSLDMGDINRTVCCALSIPKRKKGRNDPKFSMILKGQCEEVKRVDLCDLFATSSVTSKTYRPSKSKQTITFPSTPNEPLTDFEVTEGETSSTDDVERNSSWNRPLLHDIPEGARLLSVLASGRRKEHSIQFSLPGKESSDEKKDELETISVSLNRDQTKISQRWRQFATDRSVYVSENSIPASALCMTGPVEVFACCANTLEVKGGGLRVEGLTLLPPGRLFLLLAFLSFGLRPFSTGNMFDDVQDEETEKNELINKSLNWLQTWDDMVAALGAALKEKNKDVDEMKRIEMALVFHKSCIELGETLICHPDKVDVLCRIFDQIDGYNVSPWKNLWDNPFTAENLRASKATSSPAPREHASNRTEVIVEGAADSKAVSKKESKSKTSTKPGHTTEALATVLQSNGKQSQMEITPMNEVKERSEKKREFFHRATLLHSFCPETKERLTFLFATRLGPGERIGAHDLPSTNILATLLEYYRDVKLRDLSLSSQVRRKVEDLSKLSLAPRHWKLYRVEIGNGKEFYAALYENNLIPPVSFKKRGGSGLPGWVSGNRWRPSRQKHAFSCVPSQFWNVPCLSGKFSLDGSEPSRMLFYDSIEMAIRMEAAFWLERNFGSKTIHWYEHTLDFLKSKATESIAFVER